MAQIIPFPRRERAPPDPDFVARMDASREPLRERIDAQVKNDPNGSPP